MKKISQAQVETLRKKKGVSVKSEPPKIIKTESDLSKSVESIAQSAVHVASTINMMKSMGI
ncbi:MAG: hypothetical protein JAY75_17530 [Candidatus Thiodiazotropha taylori]|nr:hypothetical protein [Candidatus Thiodiazotropha taylori]MCG8093866.1 hypothetical protein [Candidatus Thiodiazotropha endolucinida]MCG7882352.1 hypothetical protein [Candidatus Thiodiazotropha taylori]MCG7886714.1 hypothetical protein [Candidatus Thiodiazotropha taylori]MCG7890602.1 hypothetical protein [Candidatus Thiodiazotropha taylori]